MTLGVDTVLIRGWDPYQDAIDYGKELILLLKHQAVTKHNSSRVSAYAR